MNAVSPTKRSRGRPPGDAGKQVAQRLLDATELLLRTENIHSLSERKIAALAEVDDRMIHYYFGGKEGLLFSVFTIFCDDFREKLKALDRVDSMSPLVTRHICEILIDAFYAKPWIAKNLCAELTQPGSVIRDCFIKKYGATGSTMSYLQVVFERLIKCGVYDSSLKSSYATLCVYSTISAPFTLTPFKDEGDTALEELKKDEWIDFVADLFDRKFRALETKGTQGR